MIPAQWNLISLHVCYSSWYNDLSSVSFHISDSNFTLVSLRAHSRATPPYSSMNSNYSFIRTIPCLSFMSYVSQSAPLSRCSVNIYWQINFSINPVTLFYFKDFIYLCVREREREHKQGERQAEGEADSPLSREPDEGLDPRTLGLWPEPKADA